MPDSNLPVAEYLRMSSEHQQYSLDNQHAVIAAYAQRRGFHIVKTYSDGARSGVVLKHRNGLRELLQDAMSGEAPFKAILVYDVSRWGRFQDADESAHYEFLCKSAGIPVHYCGEPFDNDSALQNMLMKAVKRTMAGEYSRELGVKVLAGLKRLAVLGFKQGGRPGFGLRRMLLSSEKKPKQFLDAGERKSVATERVILVPGPNNEVEIVREIYRMFVQEQRSVYGIARQLNGRGVHCAGSKWSHHIVHQILSHPKYVGCNIFGRTTQKLGTRSIRVPESDWVRTPNAFTPLVDEKTFLEAQRLLAGRTVNKSDSEILDSLRQLLATKGRLSLHLIKQNADTPSPSTYRQRFGSLRRAYELIGYGKPSDFGPIDLRRKTQAVREQVIRQIQTLFPDRVRIVRKGGRWRSCLRTKHGRVVTVLLARSIGTADHLIWQIDPVPQECRRVTLLLLLNPNNSGVHEMRLFPEIKRRRRFRVRVGDAWLCEGIQLTALQDCYRALNELRRP